MEGGKDTKTWILMSGGMAQRRVVDMHREAEVIRGIFRVITEGIWEEKFSPDLSRETLKDIHWLYTIITLYHSHCK